MTQCLLGSALFLLNEGGEDPKQSYENSEICEINEATCETTAAVFFELILN